jgi:methionyl-tRNA formyltransferase
MKIWIITMEDPLYTTGFIKDIIKQRHNDIIGLTIAKGERLKPGGNSSKTACFFTLFLMMGPYHFFRNSFQTLLIKTKKRLSGFLPGITSPGLAEYASGFDIPVSYTRNPYEKSFLAKLRKAEPDVIINQSQFIIKKPLLQIAKIGMLYRHNALLSKSRGVLTPFWVLYKADKETGVSIHFVNKGSEAGEIIVQKKVLVSKGETFSSIAEKNYETAVDAMLDALDRIENGLENFVANHANEATYNTVPALKDLFRFRFRNLKKYRHLLIGVYVFIVIALHVVQVESGIAFDNTRILTIRADYLLHAAIFFPWMGLVRVNLSGRHLKTKVLSEKRRLSGKLSGIVHRMIQSPFFWFLTGLFLASVAEVIQYWLPYRSFNLMDMLSNAAGVLLGSIVYIDCLFRR